MLNKLNKSSTEDALDPIGVGARNNKCGSDVPIGQGIETQEQKLDEPEVQGDATPNCHQGHGCHANPIPAHCILPKLAFRRGIVTKHVIPEQRQHAPKNEVKEDEVFPRNGTVKTHTNAGNAS